MSHHDCDALKCDSQVRGCHHYWYMHDAPVAGCPICDPASRGDPHEIRLDDTGAPDDIVLRCDFVHLEHCDEGAWFFAAYQGKQRTALWLTTKRNAPISANVVENELAAPDVRPGVRAVPAPQEGPPGVAAYEGLLRAVDRGASAPPAPPGPWTYQPDEHGESRWGWYFVKDGAPPRELWFDRGELSEDECIGIRDALNRVAGGASAPASTGESRAASARLDSEPKV